MTKFEIRQCRKAGKFTNRAEVFVTYGRKPAEPYMRGDVLMEMARKIVAYEVKVFQENGFPVSVA